MPGDEFHQVAPVHPNVSEGAGCATEFGINPPVGDLPPGQPVLQVGAVQQPQPTGLVAADPVPCFAHRRVVPVNERDGMHRTRCGGLIDQSGCTVRVDRQRFLADDGLAGGEAAWASSAWVAFGRADVHDVDIGAAIRSQPIRGVFCVPGVRGLRASSGVADGHLGQRRPRPGRRRRVHRR